MTPRLSQHLAQLGGAGQDRVDADDLGLRLGGNHLGERGLAATRRTVEKQRAEVVGFNQAR